MVYKFLLTIAILVVLPSFGAQNVAGQKYYLKYCSSCHGKGNRGGGLASKEEWKSYFSKEAELLIFLHEDLPEIVKYLNSKKFKNQKRKMLKFLLEFASDSDSIPSCNN